MQLRGSTLNVARAAADVVSRVHLFDDCTAAVTTAQRDYRGVDTPIGLVIVHGKLLVTNSQLATLFSESLQTSRRFTIGTIPLNSFLDW